MKSSSARSRRKILFKLGKKQNCIFCNTALGVIKNEIKFEHAEGESVLGMACDRCADALDQLEKDTHNFTDLIEEDDG